MTRPPMPPTASRHVTVVLVMLCCSCESLGYSQSVNLLQLLATGGAALLGAALLGRIRSPQVVLIAPQTMLLLGAVGMVLGLMADIHSMPLELRASLCGPAGRNLWSIVQLHLALLPWMHVGMWVGGFAAIPFLRAIRPTGRKQFCVLLAQNVACSAWMTVGMLSGGLACESLAWQSGARSSSLLLGGMFAGMVWGMVASVALSQWYLRLRPVIAMNFTQRGAGVF
jgi:hypothetical protein